MFTNSVLAVSGALLSLVAAVPMAGEHRHGHQHQHHAREYVWETKTNEVIVTVPVTKTVWIEPGETPPTYHPHQYGHSSSTTAPAAPAYTPESSSSAPVAPAYTPKSSSSAPVAPAYTAPSSTSIYVVPTLSTTSVYVAPTPSTTAPAAPAYTAPSSSASAAPAYTSASSGSSSGSSGSNGLSGIAASGTSYTGDLTWYDVGLGACGLTNVASDHIVAISEKIFDTYSNGNPNKNPLCGQYVTITGKDGSTYKAKIVDRCTGCAEADLDLSQDFFNTCTSNGDGRVGGMTWTFD
ncbi:expansin-related protein [Dothistroma septosporum NZE10]|uniref:Expansin-related protein n=1 Tax=Dothistroma septosporum (strain NZE10 / CBS 128990) TaxID=675120 RepID=N1PDR6_DOTSN|nr:expansin-related protein [Dothistroma septosporum NZE10]